MKTSQEAYSDFIKRLTHLISKNPHLIKVTLSNIFTMRLIGNKTHGDLAEIAISEFINQYMYDFKSLHVGKDMYRAKEHEEDIRITNEIHKIDFTISLKAYGDGPLQLSTDKNSKMFPRLKKKGKKIVGRKAIAVIFDDPAFSEFNNINVLPLIYDENNKRCNIMVFNFAKARESACEIRYEEVGSGRKHPVFRFYDKLDNYICEVRYGDASANALQRGLWTNTKNALTYFNSVTSGWIDYSDNLLLVKLFSHALISTMSGHEKALELLKADIQFQKDQSSLKG
ncbi:MAG: hypothetical protein HZB52_12080 [Chloroflexi bacterium]|nr:hypothetical protein [Chloroflexota bacterium]